MHKRIRLAICGVILVSFLLISSSTLVQNVQGQSLIDKIKGIEKSNILLSVMNNVLSKFKNYDENYLEKQVSKMKSLFNTRFGKGLLNSFDLDENLDENLKALTNLLFSNNFYNNIDKENGKNIVTLHVCTLTGVEEITKELSADEVTELTYLLHDMKKSLKIIDSNKTSSYEKKEAHKIVDSVYHYLKDLDLLPADIGKEESIDLITGQYGKQIYEYLGCLKIFELMKNEKKHTVLDDVISNTWCSVSCDGYAHITYLAIDPLLMFLGSLPRLIITSPILIPGLLILGVTLPILMLIWMVVIILEDLGYDVDEIMNIIDKFFNIFISILDMAFWALEPGYKLMYLHHKLIPERSMVGYASLSDGNLSVTTKGLYGSQNGNVSNLVITGFLGLWIESNISDPEFPDLMFKSTLSCNGYALSVRTPIA